MIAIFAPGQGVQTPGMLAPWLELPGVAEQLAEFGEVAGLDLARARHDRRRRRDQGHRASPSR